jgi:hypothetical protein
LRFLIGKNAALIFQPPFRHADNMSFALAGDVSPSYFFPKKIRMEKKSFTPFKNENKTEPTPASLSLKATYIPQLFITMA